MKKMVPWLITILLAITLIVLAAFLLMNQMTRPEAGTEVNASVAEVGSPPRLSAEELVKVTATIDQIKTNLSDPNYVVVINFAFQLDKEASKASFDQIKDFKVKPIIIKTLADTNPEDLTGSIGKDNLSSKLLNLINQSLPEGKVVQIDITDYIITTI
ncbi:flagellar basal body-associated FliL family protein [Paenibacillus brevis]|uniref:Flagellar protein FliL n=1 Tax=Paenibacillus brevis TaxID=2841508 RepID=A0ABS6FS49_9BACL|nr:flagellar basal body-associated FliL family protein [Paenibacillus brevis]MBU5673072.1 flagellar basal body-associated FliL family protein [Paenibacillus brevis]